jgi:serine/threonine protein kinase
MGVMDTPDCSYIVTERLEGSLKDLLQDNSNLDFYDDIMRIARSIAQGMMYLHSHKPMIIHGDLKGKPKKELDLPYLTDLF